MEVENYVATPLLCTKENGATIVRFIEITASRSTDYYKYITPNIMIKLACTKYLGTGQNMITILTILRGGAFEHPSPTLSMSR